MEVKFDSETTEKIEERRLEILKEIYPVVTRRRKFFLMEKAVGRLSRHKKLKEAMFKLVAERPYLGKDGIRFLLDELDIARLQEDAALPFFEKMAVYALGILLRIPLISWVIFSFIKMAVMLVSRHFIPARSLKDIKKKYIHTKQRARMRNDFHYLSEDAVLGSDVEDYKKHKIDLIHSLGTLHLPPRYRNASYKPSALIPQTVFKQVDSYTAARMIWPNLCPILLAGMDVNARLTADAETEEMRRVSTLLFEMIIGSEEFRDLRKGKAEQMYFIDSLPALAHTISRIRTYSPHSHRVLLRILKGAYWDTENLRARKNRWPFYLLTDIYDTHAQFEFGVEMAMENIDIVIPAIASHNIFNQAYVIAAAEYFGISDRVLFQGLWNMGERDHLIKKGLIVENYVSYGREGADAFLGRRLIEDSANESVLQLMVYLTWDQCVREAYRIRTRKFNQRERAKREGILICQI